jgi:hypothetical protein
VSDAIIAAVGRALAVALMDFAYTRKDDDKKRVAAAEYDLCKAVRDEQEQEIE